MLTIIVDSVFWFGAWLSEWEDSRLVKFFQIVSI